MRRNCDACGREYEARRKDSRTCGSTCRNRKARGAAPASKGDGCDNSLVAATRRELEAARKLDTMLGQQALALAARMSGTETTGGIAALSRELRTVMAAAVGAIPAAPPAPGQGDGVDELRARRDAKRAAG